MNAPVRAVVVFGLLVFFSGGALAAESGIHGDSMMQNEKMQNGMIHDMMNRHMSQTGKYDDKAFLSAMIPHHEAAVAMANDVLEKGKDPQVKKWAQEVIAAQEAEIAQMSEWLKSMGGEDNNAARAMDDSMHAMMTSPVDKNADRNFVIMMIDHHYGALEMATKALMKSENEKILSLANQIIAAQSKEIMEYKLWLKKNMK